MQVLWEYEKNKNKTRPLWTTTPRDFYDSNQMSTRCVVRVLILNSLYVLESSSRRASLTSLLLMHGNENFLASEF